MKQFSIFINALILFFGMLLFGVLFLASSHAADDSTLQFDADLAGQQGANSINWPMLPGESVDDVAQIHYPKDSAMQQQFVKKVLQLNANIQLKASQRFDSITLLAIPTLKSLSENSTKSVKKQHTKSLNMSYTLKQLAQTLPPVATQELPQKLLQNYEWLVSKNAYLKEKLIKLNEKIVFLEAKLGELKLSLDRTLSLPNPNFPSDSLPIKNDVQPAPTQTPAAATAALDLESIIPKAEESAVKKVFKNLDKQTPPTDSVVTSLLDKLNIDIVRLVLIVLALLSFGAFALTKYRDRLFANLSFAATKMQNTMTDFSGYVERAKEEKVEPSPEAIMPLHAAKEVESRLSSTLEEAKLLMSVNRGTDAIAHLKLTIESQPKASINHWLYLLEVFRKLNLKEDFENYAKQMRETFNVMTPVWYEKEAAINTVMIVPQSLEELPHLMEQLYSVWPGELASVYLRNLISDNRGGERVGFGKAVVTEILFLIELLDNHKDVPN